MTEYRGDWGALCWEAARTSVFAAEFVALSEDELPALLDYLGSGVELPFRFLSVHAPTKHRRMGEAEFVDTLAALPGCVDAVVVHPDTMEDPSLYARIGRRLAIENMDSRKRDGRTVEELAPLFAALPTPASASTSRTPGRSTRPWRWPSACSTASPAASATCT